VNRHELESALKTKFAGCGQLSIPCRAQAIPLYALKLILLTGKRLTEMVKSGKTICNCRVTIQDGCCHRLSARTLGDDVPLTVTTGVGSQAIN
jgi:hypothetical protein